MNKELSSSEKFLLTLLNNVNDLIVISNKRKEARDVILSFKTYAKNKGISVPDEKIDNLLSVLLDSRQNTLSYLITDIAKTIVKKS